MGRKASPEIFRVSLSLNFMIISAGKVVSHKENKLAEMSGSLFWNYWKFCPSPKPRTSKQVFMTLKSAIQITVFKVKFCVF